MRTIIAYPESEPEIRSPEPLEYDISLITPLFGGGVHAGEVDPTMPIRASSVRGHLRFWWRATRGARYTTVGELKEREGEIWGTTDIPSIVTINIEPINYLKKLENSHKNKIKQLNTDHKSFSFYWNSRFNLSNKILSYIFFPFRGKEGYSVKLENKTEVNALNSESVDENRIRFKLIINIPSPEELKKHNENCNTKRAKKGHPLIKTDDYEIGEHIEAAVWAWVNFGGIGARTRRGCGALFCKNLAPWGNLITTEWYNKNIHKYGITLSSEREWPTLPKSFFISKNSYLTFIESWEKSIQVMKDFRQGVSTNYLRLGRDRGIDKIYGRSRWPEPESIRNLIVEQRNLKKRPLKCMENPNLNYWHKIDPDITIRSFPRAEFGMPIIFEIKNEDIKPTIKPSNNQNRMASPIILKPILCEDSQHYYGLILRFRTPKLISAYIEPGNPFPEVEEDPTDLKVGYPVEECEIRSLKLYDKHPIQNRSSSGSALEAFINFCQEKENGFKKVGL